MSTSVKSLADPTRSCATWTWGNYSQRSVRGACAFASPHRTRSRAYARNMQQGTTTSSAWPALFHRIDPLRGW